MRRVWIALFLIAFLPVRGWAAVTMAGAPVLPVAPAQAAAMLCHGDSAMHAAHGPASPSMALDHAHAAAPHADSPDGAAAIPHDDMPAAAHLCTVCDLCHSPLAAPAGGFALRDAAPEAGPCPAIARDTGRLMATSLERPPRA